MEIKMKQLVKQARFELNVGQLFDGKTIAEAKAKLIDMVGECEEHLDFAEGRFRVEPYGYDGGIDLYYDLYRYETDEEFLAREEKEKAKAEAKKERERLKKEKALAKLMAQDADFELYLKLKAKFQGEE
jgi:pyruvate/2-oxoacid:ferredoxin oxidoreductase beta subunit